MPAHPVISRRWTGLALLVLMALLAPAGSASAAEKVVRPKSRSGKVVTFKLKSIDPAKVTRATLLVDDAYQRVSTGTVRKALTKRTSLRVKMKVRRLPRKPSIRLVLTLKATARSSTPSTPHTPTPATPPTTPTTPTTGTVSTGGPVNTGVLWHADMEDGSMDGWYFPNHKTDSWGGGGEFNSGGALTTASRDVAHSGSWSTKLELPNGSGGARIFRWGELRRAQTTTQSVWMYFPQNYAVLRSPAPAWWNIMQWMSRSTGNDVKPFWHLDVQNTADGQMQIALVWWQQQLEGPHQGESGYRRYTQTVANVPVGQWFQLRAELRQSNGFDGMLRIWQGDQLLFDMQNVRTSWQNCNYNAWCTSNEWAVNNYTERVEPAPSIYIDDATITAP